MIHLLEVSPDITPAQLAKLSRRYAMTGGYEVALAENLDQTALDRLIDVYLPILKEQPRDSSRFRSCNAFRILTLVSAHSDLSCTSKEKLNAIIASRE